MQQDELDSDYQPVYDTHNGQSTLDLIGDSPLYSTGSLVKKDIEELLREAKGFVTHSDIDESLQQLPFYLNEDSNHSGNLSKVFEEFNKQKGWRARITPVSDSLLQVLFNKIQVFLLRNNFSLDFLFILRRYASLLEEDGLNVMEDSFILETHNELEKGWELTPRLLNVLERFLINPENPLMALALFEHKKRRSALQINFTKWRLQTELEMNLKRLQFLWHRYIQKKYLERWERQLTFKCYDLNSEAQCLMAFKYQSIALDQWVKRTEEQKIKQDLADAFLVQKAMKKILEVYAKRVSQNSKAKQASDNNCGRRYFTIWYLNLQLSKSKRQLNQPTKAIFFRRILLKYQDVGSLQEKAQFLRKLLLTSPCLQLWKERLEEREKKMRRLQLLGLTFRQKLAMKVIKRAIHWKERESSAVSSINHTLLRHFFLDIWLKRLKERSQLQSHLIVTQSRMCKKFFFIWETQFSINARAEKVYCKNLLFKHFKLIKLNRLCSKADKNSREKLVRNSLLYWNRMTALRVLINYHQRSIMQRFWSQKWKLKFESFNNLTKITVKCHQSLLVKELFGRWIGKKVAYEDLNSKVEAFRKVKVIMQLKKVCVHTADLEELTRKHTEAKALKYKRKYMSLWQSSLEIQRRLKHEVVLDQYLSFRENTTLARLFTAWRTRRFYYNVQCTDAAKRQEFETVTAVTLRKMLEKQRLHEHWYVVSMRLDDQSKLAAYFGLLIHSYSLIRAMDIQLERINAEKNLKALVKCTNLWTMKQLKCTRNTETVEVFRNRWNRANLRAILLLWKEKSDYNDPPDPNTFSPTLYDGLGEPEDQSLVTPTRIRKSGHVTIPGSERMKQNRMEAMKNHYRRARKAIPSPVKLSDNLDTATKSRLELGARQSANASPPPKMDLGKINRKLGSRTSKISFKSIPKTNFDMTASPQSSAPPTIDRSFLHTDHRELANSPSIR